MSESEQKIEMPVSLRKFVPGREGAKQLSKALRLVIELPVKFTWNFPTVYSKEGCGTTGCAVGLAMTLWPDHFVEADPEIRAMADPDELLACDDDVLATNLGLDVDFACELFYGEGEMWDQIGLENVTPVMVADKLDAWLANNSAVLTNEQLNPQPRS